MVRSKHCSTERRGVPSKSCRLEQAALLRADVTVLNYDELNKLSRKDEHDTLVENGSFKMSCYLLLNCDISFFQSRYQKKSQPEPEFIDWGAIAADSERHEKEKWAKLPTIVKQFYEEHPDVKALDQDEVEKFRVKMNNVKVSHFNNSDTRPIPKPVKEFNHAFHNHRKKNLT